MGMGCDHCGYIGEHSDTCPHHPAADAVREELTAELERAYEATEEARELAAHYAWQVRKLKRELKLRQGVEPVACPRCGKPALLHRTAQRIPIIGCPCVPPDTVLMEQPR